MGVLNGERFLQEAVESILDQSFREFEFIVIDDGSTDFSGRMLDCYGRQDSRMRVYHQGNRGLVDALNRGCSLAQGKYLARMDADDIAIRHRLMWQVEFLERNPEIAVLGGAVTLISAAGAVIGEYRRPLTGPDLKSALLRHCGLTHPTVLMRKNAFIAAKGYRPILDAEDWDLWLRIAEQFELANLEAVLLKYRLHAHQITARKCKQQALSGLAACAAAHTRMTGARDPLDSGIPITPDLLTALGVSTATQEAAVAREYLRAVRNMYEAAEYSTARATLGEALRSLNSRFAENWVLADMRVLAACLDWQQKSFAKSLVAVSAAVMTRPKILGRPIKSLLGRLRPALKSK